MLCCPILPHLGVLVLVSPVWVLAAITLCWAAVGRKGARLAGEENTFQWSRYGGYTAPVLTNIFAVITNIFCTSAGT